MLSKHLFSIVATCYDTVTENHRWCTAEDGASQHYSDLYTDGYNKVVKNWDG